MTWKSRTTFPQQLVVIIPLYFLPIVDPFERQGFGLQISRRLFYIKELLDGDFDESSSTFTDRKVKGFGDDLLISFTFPECKKDLGCLRSDDEEWEKTSQPSRQGLQVNVNLQLTKKRLQGLWRIPDDLLRGDGGNCTSSL